VGLWRLRQRTDVRLRRGFEAACASFTSGKARCAEAQAKAEAASQLRALAGGDDRHRVVMTTAELRQMRLQQPAQEQLFRRAMACATLPRLRCWLQWRRTPLRLRWRRR
jgi:hypothetical protein